MSRAARLARRVDPWVVAVVALSVVLHFWDLGRRPLTHDEAIDAWFSWQAHTTGPIRYDPVYHGPLRFYLEGFVLGHGGTTAAWARTAAALAGVAATALIASAQRLLGRVGALSGALLFTISPTLLTVTRTGREDSLVGLVSLALLLVVANALHQPHHRHVIGAGALIGVSWTLKETTLIFGFAGACFFAGLAVAALTRPCGQARSFFQRLRGLGAEAWLWSAVAFVAITTVVFTGGFRYGSGFGSGLFDGLRYWATQHEVGRGGQRWFFYGTVYAAYEWLLVLAALVGLVFAVRRRSLVGGWFATMAFVQFAVYSWAGEKFAWLAMHPLLPLLLLGSLGAQAVADRVRLGDRKVKLGTPAGAGLLAMTTLGLAVRPAITHGADASELLVTVQTSTSVPRITERLGKAREQGVLGPILVDDRDSGSWPWVWYLHSFDDVAWTSVDPTRPLPEGFDAYLVSASNGPPVVPPGYSIERFPLRVWWLPDYDSAGFGDLVRWLTSRRTWNEPGSFDQYLIVKASAWEATTDGPG